MSLPMIGTKRGQVLSVNEVRIHEQTLLIIHYTLEADGPQAVYEGRLGPEATYPGIAGGDTVDITFAMRIPTRIHKV
ncbi:MAG: hypothetical protein K1X53_09430 [Candidatus Sumerlaeaceae bacterium]|nr:hypothetical protein [Candidatus Sumerlaeaceae bacterium]